MSRLLQLLIISLFSGLFLAACGGGGDGETTIDDGYTGLRTAVKITEENADELATESLGAGTDDFAADDFLLGVEVEVDADFMPLPNTLNLTQALTDQVRRLDVFGSSFLPGVTETETVECYESGTMVITITADEQTGNFNGSISYNDCVEFDVTLSGSATFYGVIDVNTLDSIEMTMEFTALTAVYGSESQTMNGKIYIALDGIDMYTTAGLRSTIVMNYVIRDNNTGETYKLENYRVESEDLGTEVRMSISGKFYHPDYGYGVISTIEPLLIKYTDDFPYYGQYKIDGDSSSLRVTCINSAEYTLEVDEDGDGIYEIVTNETWQ